MSSSAAADMSSSSSESVPAPTTSEVMTTNRCSAGDTAVNPPKVAAPDSAMKSSAAPPPPPALPPTSGASVATAAPLGNFLELQWTEHKDIFSQNIAKLRHKHMYTDATLACDGQFYPVHKFVLATCSEFFLAMFEWTPCVNPVLVLNNILTRDLEPILDFMYTGEMSVKECYLGHVIKAAQSLRVKGLAFPDESRPVMHKPPQPVANMNMACAGTPAGIAPQFPRPSLPSASSADAKQNSSVNKREYEPSTKRIKSELDDSKQSVLMSDSCSKLLKPPTKPISLPSISSLTAAHHDTSLTKSQQLSSISLYDPKSNRLVPSPNGAPAAPLPSMVARSHPQLSRSSSSPQQYTHLAGTSSSHPPQSSNQSSRHLQQLLSSPKSNGGQQPQQVYRNPAGDAPPQLMMQQRKKEELLQHQQQLEMERRQLQHQLQQQGRLSSHQQQHQQVGHLQQPPPHSQPHRPVQQHAVNEHQQPSHYVHAYQPQTQLPGRGGPHQLTHSYARQPSSQLPPNQQPPPHHMPQSSPHHMPQSSPHHMPQSSPHHMPHSSPHHMPQSSPHHVPQSSHPQMHLSTHPQTYPSSPHPQTLQSSSHPQIYQSSPHPQTHQSSPHHQVTPSASQQRVQQGSNYRSKSSVDKDRVSELLLEHQAELSGDGSKNSNSSTPTGNNNNLSTGNHNFLINETSSVPMMPSDAIGISAVAPNSCRGAVASSGCRGTVAVLDAAPLTPMEQQIISELGATDEAIGVEADADKTDGDAADDMLDVLVNEDSLYGFNVDPAAVAAAAAPEEVKNLAPSADGEPAAGGRSVKLRDRRSTRPRTQTRAVAPTKKRKRKPSSVGNLTLNVFSLENPSVADHLPTGSGNPENHSDGSENPRAGSSNAENPTDGCENPDAVHMTSSELCADGGIELTADVEINSDAAYDVSLVAGSSTSDASAGSQRTVPKVKCPHCSKVYHKSEALAKHLLTHQDKEYSCARCDFVSKDIGEIREHKRSHMQKHCTLCNFSTNRADAMKKHLLCHVGGNHVGDGVSSCNMCDFAPKNQTALKHHIKHHHDTVLVRDAS